MKKIFFISGVVLITVGSANAQNIINGNPFYSPAAGRFYNVLTPIELNTKFEQFYMRDEFGYGITDALTVSLSTSGSYDSSDNPQFGKWAWNDLELGLDWSILTQGEKQADVYASVKQIYNTKDGLETVAYNWTAGARVGRVTDTWTLAGIVELDYQKDDLPHREHDAWAMTVGMQGQYVIDSTWNLVGGVLFDFDLFDEYYDGERLRIELGANYNISPTKYLGLLMSKDVVHGFEDAPMSFKFQFGADF